MSLLERVRKRDKPPAIRRMAECLGGSSSSKEGTFASHTLTPLLPEGHVGACTERLSRPLRPTSPNTGSRESGRGIVVLRVEDDAKTGGICLELNAVHERRRRMALSSEGSRSRAV